MRGARRRSSRSGSRPGSSSALWFLYQLVEANFGLFGATANGGGVAFFAHVGGFVFGLVVACALLNAGRVRHRTTTLFAVRRPDGRMNLLQRIRRFWQAEPGPDHPLTQEERDSVPAGTVPEEAASLEEGFVGPEFDPDDNSGR